MRQSDQLSRLTASVTGRVQGVGFRFYARSRANSYGLTGWVRNEFDGSVRIVAEGSKSQLESFLDAIRIGPPTARVDHVAVNWGDPTGEFSTFSIR